MENDKDQYDSDMDISMNWLITYSDMITIILCFFIIFFSLNAKEMSMLTKIKDSLSKKVNTLTSENEKLTEERNTLAAKLFGLSDIEKDVKTSKEDFISFLRKNNLLDQVKLLENEKGLVIRFNDSVLFPSGKANLSNEGYELLHYIGDKLKKIDNHIIVEGFTDNVPIHTKEFPSNWELSVTRAIHVVKFLTEKKGIDEKRISVTGFGEQNPIDTNKTPEGRANNRRIEITIRN